MEEIDLKELFELFLEKKVQIILIVLIFIVLGVIYTLGFVTPMYQSSTTLVLTQSDGSSTTDSTTGETTDSITSTDLTLNSKLVGTYSELISSQSVLRQVISNLNISNLTEEDIRNNVTVSSVEDTEVIKITVNNENANYAAEIANEIANVFTDKVAEIYNINNVNILDEAEVSTSPYNVNHIRDILIFVAMGVIVALAFVFIVNMFDNTVKSVEKLEKNVGLTVIASIPVYDFDNNKGGKR